MGIFRVKKQPKYRVRTFVDNNIMKYMPEVFNTTKNCYEGIGYVYPHTLTEAIKIIDIHEEKVKQEKLFEGKIVYTRR